MKMKKMLMVILVMAVVLMSAPLLAFDPVSSSYVDGTATVEGIKHHGDETVGGWSYGKGTGSFKVWGDDGCGSSAIGEANANELLKGKDLVGPNSALSKSSSAVFSNAEQIRGQTSELSVSGLAQQGNWAEINKGSGNFISGLNFSEGGYEGTVSGPTNLYGGAITSGKTRVFIDDMSTRGVTQNQARSFIGSGDPYVDGQGYLAGGNYVEGPNYIATTGAQGTANYSASGPTSATGGLKIKMSTKIEPGENSLGLSSTVKSAAGAKGK